MLTLLIKSEALSTFDCVWTNGIFSRRYDSTRQTTTGYRKQYLSWGSFISNVTMSLFFGWMRSTFGCSTQGPLSSRTSKWVSSSGSSAIIEYVYSTIDTCIYIYWKHGIFQPRFIFAYCNKRIIFSVYDIWRTFNFLLLSVDLIRWLIEIYSLSL